MDRIEELETALDLTWADIPSLRVDDVRRLTGPGMLWDRAGAIIDLFFESVDADKVDDLWSRHARRVLDAVGWHSEALTSRRFTGGMNLAISAPMDQLYSAIFAAQTAWHFCAAELADAQPGDFDTMIADLQGVMAREANPPLIALIDTAQAHGVDCLCDDDFLSIGHGTGAQVWPVDALPTPDDIDWPARHDVPIAFITGTNGKTTTTRLCAAIARAAGKTAGLTSTDFVRVGDDILDRGDYSGPGGARMLLRDPRLEIACLEVARGGILRRGLPTRRARVAVVTNVANDHLGQYGVNTVPELAQAKFAVHRTLADDGVLVLNADDPFVVAEAAHANANIWWFSLNPDAPQFIGNTPRAYLKDDALIFFDGHTEQQITTTANVPITMDGAARYNILNALAALCVGKAMNLPDAAIRDGLASFKPDAQNNPGRCNEYAHNGARVFVDFAHNPHSIAAICDTMANLPAGRRYIMLSHAGDRSDQDITDVTRTALRFSPDIIVATELQDYLRGRELGDIPALIRQTATAEGLAPTQVLDAASPPDAVRLILNRLQPGDLALLLVLSDRDAVFDILKNPAPFT